MDVQGFVVLGTIFLDVLLCDDVMVTMRHNIVELPAEKQIKCPEVVGSKR